MPTSGAGRPSSAIRKERWDQRFSFRVPPSSRASKFFHEVPLHRKYGEIFYVEHLTTRRRHVKYGALDVTRIDGSWEANGKRRR